VTGETLAKALSFDGAGGEPATIEGRELRISVRVLT
jgi:hypothetical protein